MSENPRNASPSPLPPGRKSAYGRDELLARDVPLKLAPPPPRALRIPPRSLPSLAMAQHLEDLWQGHVALGHTLARVIEQKHSLRPVRGQVANQRFNLIGRTKRELDRVRHSKVRN